jgi:hypothetical protein
MHSERIMVRSLSLIRLPLKPQDLWKKYAASHFPVQLLHDTVTLRLIQRGPKGMYTYFNVQSFCLNNLLVAYIFGSTSKASIDNQIKVCYRDDLRTFKQKFYTLKCVYIFGGAPWYLASYARVVMEIRPKCK